MTKTSGFSGLLRPRVEPVMHRLEPLLIDMRVDLRGGDIRMPEHLLDDAQVGAVAQQVRGKRMPQQVRVNVDAHARELRDFFYNLPDAHRGESRAARGEEDLAAR